MKRVLFACFLVVLLSQHPAMGQNVQRTSADEQSSMMMMNKGVMSNSAFESSNVERLDHLRQSSIDMPVSEEMNAAGFASRIISFLASQNRIDLYGGSTDELDAYLRAPLVGGDPFGVFNRAKMLYDDATSIRSDRYEVNVDPLKMRWVFKLNLNQLSP